MARRGRSSNRYAPSRMLLSVSSTSAMRTEQAYVVGNIMITRDSMMTEVRTMLMYWLFATREPTSMAPVST